MAKKNLIAIEEQWLDDLSKLALPSGVSVANVEAMLAIKPIKVSIEIVLPKEAASVDFDQKKNGDVKKFRSAFDKKVSEFFGEIVLEDEPKDAKEILEKLNSYIEKAVKAYRVTLRTAIAKEIGAKADDLMSVGSISFKEIEFHFGVVEDSKESELLDLTKAFKRTKKVQHFGIAWKGTQCVVGVKLRKEFKPAELKSLANELAQGAKKVAGEFVAFSKTNVDISFSEKDTRPADWLVREAFKIQTGRQVHVGFGILQPPDDSAGGNATEVLRTVKATAKSAGRTISEIQKSEDSDDNLRKLVGDIAKSLDSLKKAFTAPDTFVNVKQSEVDKLIRFFQSVKPENLSLKNDRDILKSCEQFVAIANKIEMPE
ncbi:MAG: hypothetical protein K9M08_06800 [Pirellula sp.]|nr:hypothetical protein [Pirellula sp.]